MRKTKRPHKPKPPDDPSDPSGTSEGDGVGSSASSATPGRPQKASKRRTKEAQKIDVPAFPNIAQLAAYKLTILENVVCASGREDHQSVAQWVLMVEKKGTKLEDLADPGEGFSTLDRKLAAALTPTVAGELMRRINNAKRTLLKQDGKLFSGRQILFMVHEQFRTNKNLGDLLRVSWLGDDA